MELGGVLGRLLGAFTFCLGDSVTCFSLFFITVFYLSKTVSKLMKFKYEDEVLITMTTASRNAPIMLALTIAVIPDQPIIYATIIIGMLIEFPHLIRLKIMFNKQYKQILPNGNNLGIKITYLEQDKPRGLPDAFVIGEKFIGKDNVAMILGDNFFYGQNLTSNLLKNTQLKKGAKVVLHKVPRPELFGVAKINTNNKIIAIKEKPKKFLSDLAITGLYFFDNNVIKYAKKLKPSKRGEVEIVDLLNFYKRKNQLSADLIGRGGAWLDTGSIDDFYKTSTFVSAIENRQGFKIACLEEIALNNKWITKKNILSAIKFYGKCNYSNYLSALIKKR